MIVSLVGAIALVVNAQPIQTADNTHWTLRADAGLCVLEKQGTEAKVKLSIATVPGSDSYRVAIASPAIKRMASFAPASLSFTPSQKRLSGRASVLKSSDGSRVLLMDGVPLDLLDALSGADTLMMAIKSGENVSLQVAGSAKAVKALRQCNADQLIDWGADAGQFAPGGTMPIAIKDRDVWLSKSELLKVASKSTRSEIDVVFRVTVSPEGIVDECHALTDKAEKGVEKTACDAVVRKPLFTGAKDANGRSVRGVATFRIVLISRPSG